MTLSTAERFHYVKEMGTKWMPTPAANAFCVLTEWLIDAGADDVGTKRQKALERATGDIIVLLDDDDWHHPDRIAKQVAALLLGHAVVGTCNFYVHDTRSGRTTYSRTWGGADCMPAGSTAFWREEALKGPGFAPGLCAELAFQRSFRTGQVLDMKDPSLYVHVRHGNNATPDNWVLNLCDVPPAELMSTMGKDFWWKDP